MQALRPDFTLPNGQLGILAHAVWPSPTAPLLGPSVVICEGDRIVAVSPIAALPSAVAAEANACLAAANAQGIVWLATPGLINMHTHLEQHALAFNPITTPDDPEAFVDWILAVVAQQRAQRALPPEAQQATMASSVRAGIHACWQYGVTTVNDIVSSAHGAQVHAEMGMTGAVSLELLAPFDTMAAAVLPRWQETYASMVAACQGMDTLRVGVSPHSPYNCHPVVWQAFLRTLQQHGLPMPAVAHMHVAESLAEQAWLTGQPGPIDRLHQTLLGQCAPLPQARNEHTAWGACLAQYAHPAIAHWVLVHGIQLAPDDIEGIRHSLGTTSWCACPRSNRALHGHMMHPGIIEALGESLVLGTDGCASTPTLNVRAERLPIDSPVQALSRFTTTPAKILGLEKTLGTLHPHQLANVVVWSLPLASSTADLQVAWADGEGTVALTCARGAVVFQTAV